MEQSLIIVSNICAGASHNWARSIWSIVRIVSNLCPGASHNGWQVIWVEISGLHLAVDMGILGPGDMLSGYIQYRTEPWYERNYRHIGSVRNFQPVRLRSMGLMTERPPRLWLRWLWLRMPSQSCGAG